MEKLSIIIPTMQKDISVLQMLLSQLDKDICVDEIIVIDNSIRGFEHNFSKVRVIIPKRNLYVNPSWNLGVSIAKNEYIGILNDDLILPLDYCHKMLEFISENKVGLVGIDTSSVHGTDRVDFKDYPVNGSYIFDEINDTYITGYWGSAIFSEKKNFCKIPKKLKIWCGDNYLLFKNIQKGKQNYKVVGANIKHLGSLSVDYSSINNILEDDICFYARIDKKYINHPMYKKPVSFLKKIFSVKNEKRPDKNYKVITILGIKLKFKRKSERVSYSMRYHSEVREQNDPRRIFINYIKEKNTYVLDVGCACGDFAKELKKNSPESRIYGIEYDPKSIHIAKQNGCFDDIWQADLMNFDYKKYRAFFGAFDYISFGDILEHVDNPLNIINNFKNFIKRDGKILISFPNVAHASIKANLLLNNFDYTETGLLDRTHIRFFTYKTIAKLCADAELRIEECCYTDWCGKFGTQENNPYNLLPDTVNEFILSDKHSKVCQYVIKTTLDNNIAYIENLKTIDDAVSEILTENKSNN